MVKSRTLLAAALSVASLSIPMSAVAATIYKVTFDGAPSSPAPTPYVPVAGDVLPAGVTTAALANTDIATPSVAGDQGGNVLQQNLGATWPNVQGYRFGKDAVHHTSGTAGPTIANTWTFEAVIRPSFNNTGFGLAGAMRLWDSGVNDANSIGDNRIYVDQNTGKLTFDPRFDGGGFGEIVSTSNLQADQWYHIAAVVKGTGDANQRTELWINGVLDNTGSYPLTWETQGQFTIPGYFSVGSDYIGATQRNWQGEIDAFAISDTALDSSNFVLGAIPEPSMTLIAATGFLFASRRRR